MPGVEAVYTGADLVKDDIGTIPTLAIFKRPDGKPMTVPPRRLLAHEIVRYAGEAVAAVVATSRVLAQTAAEAIVVDYEVLPSVVDPVEAVKPGAPVVWPEAPDNIVGGHELWRRRQGRGGLCQAPRIRSRSISSASGWCRRRWSRARPLPRSTRRPAG